MSRTVWKSILTLGIFQISCTLLPATTGENKLAVSVQDVLEKAESIELISLSPMGNTADSGFRGWTKLGSVTFKEADKRKKVVSAILKGIKDSDGTAALCFNPRHAIRATHEKSTVDMVICFECNQIQIYTGKEDKPSSVLTASSQQMLLDGMLKAANIPLASKEK